MAAQVLIAHTGQRLPLDSFQYSSLDEFKASMSQQTSIPTQCIITLTAQGRPLRFPAIQTEKEIYVYDNRITQASSPGTPSAIKVDLPVPKRYNVTNPPNFVDDVRSLSSWQDLCKQRREWALKIVEDCEQMANTTHERYAEMDVMLRCLDAAVANTESVVKGLEPKYAELKKWAPEAQADYGVLTTNWEQYLSLARSIPISTAMVRFMTGRELNTAKSRVQRQASLEDLIDLETARKAGRLAPSALRKFNGRIADLDKVATRLFQDAEDLFQEFEKTVARSALSHDGESHQLFQDIEAVAKKIDTDYQTIMEYSSPRDAGQASKIAQNHTERLLPSIRNRALEMDDMLRYATQARNGLAAESAEFMRNITDITSRSTNVKSQVNNVNQEDELNTFDYLRLIQQVPYMYASFAAEALKRREWLDKVKQDSSALANEMALFQEEEVKRRRRWLKSVGDAYGPELMAADANVAGLEVNMLGNDEQFPAVSKQELEDFYDVLQKQNVDSELVSDIANLITELNNPTKQQSKRMRAFKNGSVHEAALGRSGLLIRGDDELLRSLQEDKSKLDSKLKTAESRVRRLEDLLHRQSQASRLSIGNIFQMPSQQFSDRSDRNDSTISMKSPQTVEDTRISTEGTDSALVQRIQQLEAELTAEKERSALFENDLTALTTQHNDIKGQMEEANSTKKDLMENMEALKREFMEERKSLESEIKKLKARLEDTEDDLEHFGESRENEKASYEDRVQALELEVKQMTNEKHVESLKTEGQIEFLRKEARLQRENVEVQEKQLQSLRDETKSLTCRLEQTNEAREAQLRALHDLHGQLIPEEPAPEDLSDLTGAINSKLGDILGKTRNVQRELSLTKADLGVSEASTRELQNELSAMKDQLAEEEVASRRLRDNLAEEKAKASALEKELADEREQLNQLRVKISDGETGSDSLRKRLEDNEWRITSLTEDLASRQSHVGSLEEEVRLYTEKLQDSQTKLAQVSSHLESRTERTKDLTQRLYSQNERLTRLLERLGFSVIRQGETMIIQKVPRSERSPQNATESDPSASLRRSGTLGNLNSQIVISESDLELLQWMNKPDADTESETFKAFISTLGSFDADAFSEAIFRRVKDVEHKARKLQHDGRSYRDKAHVLQKEAHDKIAYKHFKEGDLALFLPTRNQTTGAWAAFNVGFPHYFLREQEAHKLRSREWLLARITRVQERVVDLSKSLHQSKPKRDDASVGTETESLYDDENDNPFDLSDGLRWYLIDAQEDKSGAPSTPGLGKSTVAANNVEAMADMATHPRAVAKGVLGSRGGLASGIEGVSKSLSKSLDSRRSSTGSRKALPFAIGGGRNRDSAQASETNSLRAAPADTPVAASPTQQHAPVSVPVPEHAESEAPSQDDDGTVAIPNEGTNATSTGETAQDNGASSEMQAPEVRDIDSLLGP